MKRNTDIPKEAPESQDTESARTFQPKEKLTKATKDGEDKTISKTKDVSTKDVGEN